MSELEKFLAHQNQFVSAGQGGFTIDPRRQRELLQTLGLYNTKQGFLKLFQGIYRSQPGHITVSYKQNLFKISFSHDLPLPCPLWEGQHPLCLATLCLSHLYRIQWEDIQGDCCFSGQAYQDEFVSQESSVSEVQKAPHASITITYPWHRWWLPGPLQLSLLGFKRYLLWHKAPLTWNGKNLPAPSALSSRAQAVVLSGSEFPGNLNLVSASNCKTLQVRNQQLIGSQLAAKDKAHAVLGATRNSWSETFFVIDGVLSDGERNLLDRPGIVAVVSADGLTTALDGLSLVHDAAFRQRLQNLRPEVSWLDNINQQEH